MKITSKRSRKTESTDVCGLSKTKILLGLESKNKDLSLSPGTHIKSWVQWGTLALLEMLRWKAEVGRSLDLAAQLV